MGPCGQPSRYLVAEYGWASCGRLVLCLDLTGLGTTCVREWKAKLRLHATWVGQDLSCVAECVPWACWSALSGKGVWCRHLCRKESLETVILLSESPLHRPLMI